MGEIKTALEIALKKTETVKSGKKNIEQFEARQRGKRIASAFIAGKTNLAKEIKSTPEAQRESLKQGIFDVFISQIALPADKNDEKRFETVGKGLEIIINDSRFPIFFRQLSDFFAKYMLELFGYKQAIHQQYASKLRQKEEELSQRLGREVRIDPFQDPEFVALYNQSVNSLKSNYEGLVNNAREEILSMFKGSSAPVPVN